MRTIEVCLSNLQGSTTDKGNLLEEIIKELLKIQQYKVVKNIQITGMEIDLLAEHKVSGDKILVECKAWKDAVPSKIIIQLIGSVDLEDVSAGWLITTGPFTKDAEGLREKIETEKKHPISFYTADKIIAALIDGNIIKDNKEITTQITDKFNFKDAATLLITDIGLFWTIPIFKNNSSDISSSVIAFNARNGSRITDQNTLTTLNSLDTQYKNHKWESGEEIDSRINDELQKEYESITRVISGDDWSDYRPARPGDFVGRKSLLSEIFSYFDGVIDGNSDTRLFAIKGPSGIGKSSLLLKLTSMSRRKRNESHSYYVYAIDVRTALSPRYAELAIKSCIDEADKAGFTDVKSRKLETINLQQIFQDESIIKTFEYLKSNNKLIVIIFDQFEELLSKKELAGLFDKIKLLSNILESIGQNIVMGFAWKSDLTIPADHPAYYMWSNLSDRRREFDIQLFQPKEIQGVIRKFGIQLGERINPILIRYLTSQCQGYPWLLKKLCIHVYNLINEGSTQDTIIGKKLDIIELFKRDLSNLSIQENGCVVEIAKTTPSDYFKIDNLYGRDVIQSLIDRRIVIHQVSKLVLYWDIFKDYVLNGTIPKIILDYIPQYTYSSFAKMLMPLLEYRELPASKLAEIGELNKSTLDNFTIDAVMFGVAKKENGIISLTVQTDKEVVTMLQDFFKKHILYDLLQTHVIDGGDYDYFRSIFNGHYKQNSKNISDDTLRTYSSKLYNWLLQLGLIIEDKGLFYVKTIDADQIRLNIRKSRRNKHTYLGVSTSVFLGLGSPSKTSEVYNLISNGVSSYDELKKKKYRNHVEVLSMVGGIIKSGDEIIIKKSYDEILKTIKESETIKMTQNALESNPKILGRDIGNLLDSHFPRGWKDQTKVRYGNSLLKWAKYFRQKDTQKELFLD